MSNIVKGFYSVFFILLPVYESFGQVLHTTTNLDLNPGGVIYDIEHDPYHGVYILVGNFSSIGGTSVQNFAVIDDETLQIESASNLYPFISIDGEIRSIAFTRTYVPMASNLVYHIYLGGNFGTVTGNNGSFTRNGVVEFTSQQGLFSPPSSSTNYTVSAWDAQLDMTPGYDEGVNDLAINNDTLYIVGSFYESLASPTGNACNANYDIYGGVFLADHFIGYMYDLELVETYFFNEKRYVIGSKDYYDNPIFIRFSEFGTIDNSFNYESIINYDNYGVYKAAQLGDTILLANYDSHSLTQFGDYLNTIRLDNGALVSNHPLSETGESVHGGVSGSKNALAVYKNYVYCSSSHNGSALYSYEVIPDGGTITGTNWNGNVNNITWGNRFGGLEVRENKLFFSSPYLTTAEGQPSTGLAVYCLEPHDPKYFTAADSTVCPDQAIVFSIPPVQYADGYLWEYSESCANINSTGQNIFEGSGSSFNSVSVTFTFPFQPGQLSVTPFSYCNDGADILYSKPMIANIVSNPLPDIDAGVDTTFNCSRDTILLIGSSSTGGVSFDWFPPAPQIPISNDSIIAYTANMYVFRVEDTLGCPNYDTLYITQDTAKPNVMLPPPPYDLTCSEAQKVFSGSSLTPDTESWWRILATGDSVANPITVSLPGTYRYIVRDTMNTCADSLDLLVYLNQPQPNIFIQGYPPLIPSQSLDTLTCFLPVLNLICDSDTANTTVTWCNADSTGQIGNSISISTGGNYYMLATDSVSGCMNFTGVNIAEFLNPPDVILPVPGNLNCSVDSVLADGSSSISNVNLFWTGGAFVAEPDPIYIVDPGNYLLEVIRTDNGCSETDSLFVTYSPEINLFAGSDTMACDESLILLTGNITGTLTGVSWLWNSGSTSSSNLVEAGTDSLIWLDVTADGGCFGSDTLIVSIPPAPVIGYQAFKPCSDDDFGQIVLQPFSGLAPFSYSIDNGATYQSDLVLDSLDIGTYTIWIKDSLGCDYEMSATIDESSDLPQPGFLFSTYNYVSDTVALINVANPPADSVTWIIPPELQLIQLEPYPLILIPDTGTFAITMHAFYGSCQVDTTKMLYSSAYDSTLANLYNANGIKSILLYPNPNSGQFTVDVEFYKQQHCALEVRDLNGLVIYQASFGQADFISDQISLSGSLVSGTYFVHVIAEFDAEAISFVINP